MSILCKGLKIERMHFTNTKNRIFYITDFHDPKIEDDYLNLGNHKCCAVFFGLNAVLTSSKSIKKFWNNSSGHISSQQMLTGDV